MVVEESVFPLQVIILYLRIPATSNPMVLWLETSLSPLQITNLAWN